MDKYKPRIIDTLLKKKLQAKGAVLIEGPKWCGKTTTCEQFAKSAVYMADPLKREENLRFAGLDIILTGSSVVPKDKEDWIVHTGTGRIARLRMRPMSLWESGESTGEVSIGELLKGNVINTAHAQAMGIGEIAYLSSRWS